ncbi:MAG: hypothetical protein EA428_11390 [Spirochaetaceae bacterium]|nr:MAG: hypothetical protein EA428_11390 [Spirochaetaceae bacterium]
MIELVCRLEAQMCEKVATVNLGFGEELFPAGVHICLVYRDETERQRVVSRFVESGLLGKERVFYIADTITTEEVANWLGELEVDIEPERQSGAFTVDVAATTYCPEGVFVPEQMCETLKQVYSSAFDAGYPASRVTGEMSWALRGISGSDRLIEYESAVNTVLQTHPITAMCQYDANRFSGRTVFEALQVHPYMIMNEHVVKNPYYLREAPNSQHAP